MLRNKSTRDALSALLESMGVRQQGDAGQSAQSIAAVTKEELSSPAWGSDMARIVDELCVQIKLRGHARDMLRLYRAMKDCHLDSVFSVKQYNIIIDVCFKASMFDEGMEVYHALTARDDLRPSEITFNLIINSWMKSGNVEEVMRIIQDEMIPVCKPSPSTLNPILDFYTKQGDIDKARDIIKWMFSMDIQPDIVAFHSLIHGYCQWRKYDEARDVIREMKEENHIDPTADTFQIIVNGYLTDGMVDAAEKLVCVDMSKVYDVRPSEKVFNAFISRLVKMDQADRARRILDKYARFASSAAYNALLAPLVREETHENMQKAERLVEAMWKKSRCKPDTVTYTLLIEGYGRLGKYRRCQSLVDQLYRNGLEPSRVTYKILNKFGLTGEPSADLLQQDGNYAGDGNDGDEMYGSGYPNVGDYSDTQQHGEHRYAFDRDDHGSTKGHEEQQHVTIDQDQETSAFPVAQADHPVLKQLNRHIRALSLDQAVFTLRKLIALSLVPPARTMGKLYLQLCRAKETSTLVALMDMLSSNSGTKHMVDADAMLFHTIIQTYFETGQTKEAMSTFHAMKKDAPHLVSGETYAIVINGFKHQSSLHQREDEADEVQESAMRQAASVFDDMVKDGVRPGLEVYNSLLDGLARAGDIDRCLALYEQLKGQSLTPNVATFTSLFQVCEERGYRKKAEALLREMREEYSLGTDPLSSHTFEALVKRITTRDKLIEKKNRKFLREKEEDMLILSQKYTDIRFDQDGNPLLSH